MPRKDKGIRTPAQRAKMRAIRLAKVLPFADRFWSNVNKNGPGGCWIWTAAISRYGYGAVWNGTRTDVAHRVVFRLLGREIPEGLEVDHICRERRCCNPDHLRFVTKVVNSMENNLSPLATNARKTACKDGHPLEGANLARYLNPTRGRWTRVCLTCRPHYWRWAVIPRDPPPGAHRRSECKREGGV